MNLKKKNEKTLLTPALAVAVTVQQGKSDKRKKWDIVLLMNTNSRREKVPAMGIRSYCLLQKSIVLFNRGKEQAKWNRHDGLPHRQVFQRVVLRKCSRLCCLNFRKHHGEFKQKSHALDCLTLDNFPQPITYYLKPITSVR